MNGRRSFKVIIIIITSLGLFLTGLSSSRALGSGSQLIEFNEHQVNGELNKGRMPIAVDLDEDGDMDIVTTSNEPLPEFSWWENNGEEVFIKHLVDSNHIGRSIYAEDFDQDGDIDLISAAEQGLFNWQDHIIFWENDGFENFTKTLVGQHASVDLDVTDVTDIDNDGDLDLITICNNMFFYWDRNFVSIWYNDGSAHFTEQIIAHVTAPIHVDAEDIDQDGDIDLAVGAGEIYWMENIGNQTFVQHSLNNPTQYKLNFISALDLDLDGDIDIVYGLISIDEIVWLVNIENQIFEPTILQSNYGSGWIDVIDFDKDDDPDLVVGSNTNNQVSLMYNDGSGNFSSTVILDNFGQSLYFGVYDIDQDGNLDILGIDHNTNLKWWEQVIVNSAPTVSAGGPYFVDEGSSINLLALGYDPDNDPLIYDWDLDNDGTFERSGPETVFLALSLDGPISQTITARVTDTNGFQTSDVTTINVRNVKPTIENFTAPLDPNQTSIEIIINAEFLDPGQLDTHTALIDWGDGSSSIGIVNESYGLGSVSGGHSYSAPNLYPITLTITDKDGGTDTIIYQYVVVYDPTVGFVTGGGWITSPAGAYSADPTLTGDAYFGFVSKYQKGKNLPTGNTEFQFRVADLNFHSNTYDWLLVNGAKAIFKGTGTINGEGNYKFCISLIDGQIHGGVDKIRMKIWWEDENDVDHVIYDNQLGTQDDADPTTIIQGGSIIIHE